MTNFPDNIFGINAKEAYDKIINAPDVKPPEIKKRKSTKKPKEEEPKPQVKQPIAVNLSEYIYLPNHELYVAKQRTELKKDWYGSHRKLHEQSARMLTLREFADFLLLLGSMSSIQGISIVENGLGQKLATIEREVLYHEITDKRDPHRGEFLDAYFIDDSGNGSPNFIDFNYRSEPNGTFGPKNHELLEDYVKANVRVHLKDFNRQGLPTAPFIGGFGFYEPERNNVAVYEANSSWSGFNCQFDPDDIDGSIGVRFAYEKQNFRSAQ